MTVTPAPPSYAPWLAELKVPDPETRGCAPLSPSTAS